MAEIDDLLADIFDGKKSALYTEFEGWVRGSRRFKTFADAYRTKIRSKLRSLRDEGGANDLRAELETAAILLREPQFSLEYEKYAASGGRGPDFTITFKTHTPFNVEVRRIRGVELDDNGENDGRITKLMTVLCDKVGQMPPSTINILWLTAERALSEADVTQAVTTLRLMAERKNEAYFTRRGYKNAADFLKKYQQLSGIVLHQSGGNVVWLNPLARHQAPPAMVTALKRV